jgi:PEP-CTERM motif-containing protein
MRAILIVLCAAITPCFAHAATTVFADNFDTDTPGLNVTPSGWSISNGGTVDTIANGGFGITCAGATGRCIDLDGTSGKSGNLVSPGLNLLAGQTYTAFFDLSGNQRALGQTDVVSVSFDTAMTSVSVLGNAAFGTHSVSFTPATSGTFHLSFLDSSRNNLGAILDNVNVQTVAVPEPETLAMMIAGLGLLGVVARWRRRKQH